MVLDERSRDHQQFHLRTTWLSKHFTKKQNLGRLVALEETSKDPQILNFILIHPAVKHLSLDQSVGLPDRATIPRATLALLKSIKCLSQGYEFKNSKHTVNASLSK